MSAWKPLRKGDLVDVVAPSWGCGTEEFTLCKDYLCSLGLRVRAPSDILTPDAELTSGETVEWTVAAGDEARGRQLRSALEALDSVAVFCIRGGSGAAIALEQLRTEASADRPAKLFVGFSDLTHVHTWLNQHWGWATIHGAHLLQLSREPERRPEWEDAVFGRSPIMRVPNLAPLNDAARRVSGAGIAVSTVNGGNLTTISLALGTSWSIARGSSGSPALLLIEDDNGEPFHTERMLIHLRHANAFEGVAAVLFGKFMVSQDLVKGGFSSMGKKQEAMKRLRSRFAESFLTSIPVVATDAVGHGPENLPVPFGTPATLRSESEGLLELLCVSGAMDGSST